MVIACQILGIMSITWALANILTMVFKCKPINRSWNVDIPGTCLNAKTAMIANAVPNILTDVAIIALPLVVVARISVSPSERLSLIGLFMLGSW